MELEELVVLPAGTLCGSMADHSDCFRVTPGAHSVGQQPSGRALADSTSGHSLKIPVKRLLVPLGCGTEGGSALYAASPAGSSVRAVKDRVESGIGSGRRWPTAIDLFCGAGGLSLGLRRARFRVAAALDVSPLATESYHMNFPGVPLICGDVRDATGPDLLRAARLGEGELDLLAGCPPCQGFSELRTKRRQSAVDDHRNDLTFEFLRLVCEARPRFVLMENVPGLGRDDRFHQVVSKLKAFGYGVESGVLNSADFGTPQRRRRLVLAAARGDQPRLKPGNTGRLTVRDAIGGLVGTAGRSGDPLHDHGEQREERVRSVIASIPKDGGSRADLGASEQLLCHRKAAARGDGWGRDSYGRMAWDRPAPTITGGCVNPSKGRFLHPDEDRAITLREALLLQGFPADYRLSLRRGKYAAAELVGNAIPPPFVTAQALTLRQMFGCAERPTA